MAEPRAPGEKPGGGVPTRTRLGSTFPHAHTPNPQQAHWLPNYLSLYVANSSMPLTDVSVNPREAGERWAMADPAVSSPLILTLPCQAFPVRDSSEPPSRSPFLPNSLSPIDQLVCKAYGDSRHPKLVLHGEGRARPQYSQPSPI